MLAVDKTPVHPGETQADWVVLKGTSGTKSTLVILL